MMLYHGDSWPNIKPTHVLLRNGVATGTWRMAKPLNYTL